jgi:tripartite ATP-independent transporter DctM subunit
MTVVVFLFSLLGAMAIGMPVAFSAHRLRGRPDAAIRGCSIPQIIAQNMIVGADTFTLLAIPFFPARRRVHEHGRAVPRIVDFAVSWIGHVRGGLGIVAIVAAVIMASLSGSAAADTAALAAILLPMMRNAGYDVGRSAGLIAAGGVIAPVIPPSVAFIIFGVAANVSITRLFLAGIFPGILMGLSLLVAWLYVARRDNVKPLPRQSMEVRLRSTLYALPALVMPVIVLGGIRFGVFTPTEAAVVAAIYALLVGLLVYREFRLPMLYGTLLAAAKTTSVVMFLVASAHRLRLAHHLRQHPGRDRRDDPAAGRPADAAAHRHQRPGARRRHRARPRADDPDPHPVLMPIIKQAGIDPVYFGVLFVMNNCIGLSPRRSASC